MLLQFDDSPLWGSIFQTESGKLLFQEKDMGTTYAFTPALQQAVKWEGKLPLRGLSALSRTERGRVPIALYTAGDNIPRVTSGAFCQARHRE